jgi:flagellar biosynthesis/type III secretory pathway protein FliH
MSSQLLRLATAWAVVLATGCAERESPSSSAPSEATVLVGEYQRGYVSGHDRGYADGRQEGYDDGYARGLDDGRNEGRSEALDCVRGESVSVNEAADACE